MIDISKFDINKLVDFVNLELQKNKSLSVNKFCDKYDIKKATLKTRMKRSGYSFNQETRKYENNTTRSITTTHKDLQQNTTCNTTDKKIQNNVLDNTKDIDINKLNLLLDHIDDVLKLIQPHNTTSSITLTSKDTKVTSLRINVELYEKVKIRALRDNQSISDIVNRALLDYLKNYI